MYIDQSVYPDVDEPPSTLETVEDKADYMQRICAAWDFGVHPEPETFRLFAQWKELFDAYPLLASPAYHAFCAWFGWDALPYSEGIEPPTPQWLILDRLEGRPPDPCENMI